MSQWSGFSQLWRQMAKLNKGSPAPLKAGLPTPKEIHQSLVRFSFKYLELGHGKFCLPDSAQKAAYLLTLFDKLKQISTMKFADFRQAGKALRSHAIDWDKTSEPDGYAHLNEQMQQCEPWQFSLAREELGRVHGLLLDDVFYVVWVDHEHKLYNGRAH
jgi:hypothetical protein